MAHDSIVLDVASYDDAAPPVLLRGVRAQRTLVKPLDEGRPGSKAATSEPSPTRHMEQPMQRASRRLRAAHKSIPLTGIAEAPTRVRRIPHRERRVALAVDRIRPEATLDLAIATLAMVKRHAGAAAHARSDRLAILAAHRLIGRLY